MTPDDFYEFCRLNPDLNIEEYIANGAQLGWPILPENRSVVVYRPGQEAQLHSNIDAISGDPELPGFTLDLTTVWQPLP
jgi:Uma2 family endonuclease